MNIRFGIAILIEPVLQVVEPGLVMLEGVYGQPSLMLDVEEVVP